MKCHKNGFVSKEAARTIGKVVVKMGRADQNRPYFCSRCGLWHLTSMSKREYEQQRA